MIHITMTRLLFLARKYVVSGAISCVIISEAVKRDGRADRPVKRVGSRSFTAEDTAWIERTRVGSGQCIMKVYADVGRLHPLAPVVLCDPDSS